MRRAFPEQAAGFVRGAKALLEAGRTEEAAALANQAVALFPDHPRAHVHRAEAAMRCADWPTACEHWAATRRAFPDQAAGFVRGAKALLEAGRTEEAEAVASEAVALFPDHPRAHVHRAEAAMRQRKREASRGR